MSLSRIQEREARILSTPKIETTVSDKTARKWSWDPNKFPLMFVLSLIVNLGLISVIACNALHVWDLHIVKTGCIYTGTSIAFLLSLVMTAVNAEAEGIFPSRISTEIPVRALELPRPLIGPFLENATPYLGERAPEEIVQNILSHCTLEELVRMRLVSRNMKASAELMIIERAIEYGFSRGDDKNLYPRTGLEKASSYLKKIFEEVVLRKTNPHVNLFHFEEACSYLGKLFEEIEILRKLNPSWNFPHSQGELFICQMRNLDRKLVIKLYFSHPKMRNFTIHAPHNFTNCLIKLYQSPNITTELSESEAELGSFALWDQANLLHVEECEILLRCGVNRNALDLACLDTALSMALGSIFFRESLVSMPSETAHNKMQALVRLLTTRENVNVKDYQGFTPLHKAVINYCNPSVINHLLREGADLNAENTAHRTPLYFAFRSSSTLKLLVAWGADPIGLSEAQKSKVREIENYFSANEIERQNYKNL